MNLEIIMNCLQSLLRKGGFCGTIVRKRSFIGIFLLERKFTMRKLRSTALALVAVMLFAAMVSCAQTPLPRPIPVAPAEPLSPAPEIPYDTTDYEKKLDNAFAEAVEVSAADLDYEIVDGKATVKGYKGSETAIAIPETLENAPVTKIAGNAFADNTTLEVLVLPGTVEAVGASILKGCTALRALKTPLLGENAEKNSHLGYLFGASTYMDNARDVPPSLKLLEIDGAFAAIPDFALFDCNDLVAVRLSKSITTLGKYSFYGCFSLKYLTIEHLEKIDAHAMDSCTAFVSLEFSASLTEIGLGAFQNCTDLRSITLPFVGGSKTANTYLGYIFGAEYPDFAKGYYPGRLQEVHLLAGCTALGDYAFFECETLRKVTIPEGVTAIGVRAFDDCDALSVLALPASLESIRENAFMDCDYLTTVTFAGENLKTIGVNAFYGCLSLAEIALPDSLTALPGSCFADCVSLKKVTMNGVSAVGVNAFHNCVALEEVVASSSVKYEKGNDAATRLNEE